MFKSVFCSVSMASKRKTQSILNSFFVICIEVKRLVLYIFTLIFITHSLEQNTQALFAYERSRATKIKFIFSSFNWITATEMIFLKITYPFCAFHCLNCS